MLLFPSVKFFESEDGLGLLLRLRRLDGLFLVVPLSSVTVSLSAPTGGLCGFVSGRLSAVPDVSEGFFFLLLRLLGFRLLADSVSGGVLILSS